MKQFFKSNWVVLSALVLCTLSCSKKNSVPIDVRPALTALLTSHTWSMVMVASDDNHNNQIDNTEFQPFAVNAYNYMTFSADGSALEQRKGASSNTVVTTPYNWVFRDPETIKVTLTSGNGTVYRHLKQLTASAFDYDEYNADNSTLSGGFQCVPE